MPKQELNFREIKLMSNIIFPEIDNQDFDIQALNAYINLMPKYQNTFKNFDITNLYQLIIKKLISLKFNA